MGKSRHAKQLSQGLKFAKNCDRDSTDFRAIAPFPFSKRVAVFGTISSTRQPICCIEYLQKRTIHYGILESGLQKVRSKGNPT